MKHCETCDTPMQDKCAFCTLKAERDQWKRVAKDEGHATNHALNLAKKYKAALHEIHKYAQKANGEPIAKIAGAMVAIELITREFCE